MTTNSRSEAKLLKLVPTKLGAPKLLKLVAAANSPSKLQFLNETLKKKATVTATIDSGFIHAICSPDLHDASRKGKC